MVPIQVLLLRRQLQIHERFDERSVAHAAPFGLGAGWPYAAWNFACSASKEPAFCCGIAPMCCAASCIDIGFCGDVLNIGFRRRLSAYTPYISLSRKCVSSTGLMSGFFDRRLNAPTAFCSLSCFVCGNDG